MASPLGRRRDQGPQPWEPSWAIGSSTPVGVARRAA